MGSFTFVRRRNSHKGENGYLLVVGGSSSFVGAPWLSSLAALRVGVDKVILASFRNVLSTHLFPEVLPFMLSGSHISSSHLSILEPLFSKVDVVLLGPGLGPCSSFMKALLKRKRSLFVVDADALSFVDFSSFENSVFTPHSAEFERLMQSNSLSSLGSNVVLRKGPVDEIITAERTFLNSTGSPALTKAGTGDVLAGVVAGLLAQFKDPVFSARAGAWLVGRAGERLSKSSFGFLASELAEEVAKLMRWRVV